MLRGSAQNPEIVPIYKQYPVRIPCGADDNEARFRVISPDLIQGRGPERVIKAICECEGHVSITPKAIIIQRTP